MNSDNEKIYGAMKFSAAVNIVLGVIIIVCGITGGILLLISGGRLFSNKSKIMF